MTRELAPFRLTPNQWFRVTVRNYRLPMLAYYVTVGVAATLVEAWAGVPQGKATMYGVIVGLSTLAGHVALTRFRIGRQKGLPWEEQRVVVDDDFFQTTYESGFVARVPWTKFRRVRRFPEGLWLQMEGRGQAFLPKEALDVEDEALILRSISAERS